MGSVGLQTAIWNNNIKSFLLLAFYPVVIGLLVWVLAGLYGLSQAGHVGSGNIYNWAIFQNSAHTILQHSWLYILGAIGLWFAIAFFNHDRMIRSLAHSKPVSRVEEPVLYNLLENLCIAQGLTIPHLNIIETDALNAFASGIDERSYSITVTRGLMNTLTDDEMEAVLGHELSHIINRDVRLLIISIIFTGMLGFLAQFVWSLVRSSLRGSSRRKGQGVFILMIVSLVLWIGYLATLFTRFALSRRREFMADAGAVALTKNPDAMMRALQRISGRDHIPGATADIGLICIENSQAFMGLFATHPPIEARIRALSTLTQTPVPDDHMDTAGNPWAR